MMDDDIETYLSYLGILRIIRRKKRMATIKATRTSIFPKGGDTWESIALRELPDMASKEAISILQSWNLHVFMRPAAAKDSTRAGNPILPSDVIFVAPPQA